MLFDTETSVRCLLDVIGRATQQQSGQLEKPSLIRTLRREAARVETFLSQKIKAVAAKS